MTASFAVFRSWQESTSEYPNEANDQASAGHQCVPSVMPKRGQENNEQRDQ
jgi:hypothetical protein